MHAPVAHAVSAAPIARAVVREINAVRRSSGLPAVRLARDLERVARGHTRDMLSHQRMTHDASDGTSFAARVGRRLTDRYRRVGETIFWTACASNPTGGSIVQAWMDSPPHRAQLLDARYRSIGVATVTGDYQGTQTMAVTADFGVRRVPMRA